MKRLDHSVVAKVKVTERFKIPVNVHLDISSTAKPFVTKLSMVMRHYGPEHHARRLVCCLQVQGHSEGSKSDMTVSTISTELLIFFATRFNWMVHHHKFFCKN